jgi:hypothetical protein
VKEQEGNGELLSFAAFELLRGVFNKELDSTPVTPGRDVNWRRA